jgi:hypothetical protein
MLAWCVGPASLAAQRDTTAAAAASLFYQATEDSTSLASIDPVRMAVLQKRIALALDGVSLRQALWEISAVSGLRFVYADDAIGADRLVHLHAQGITVAAALTQLLQGAAVDVVVRPGGSAVLVRAPNAVVPLLHGTVGDSLSREPIAGAVVMLMDSSGSAVARTLTNARGEYRIAVAAASRRARVVRLGFAPRDVTIPAGTTGNAHLDLRMLSLPTLLDTAHVQAYGRCRRKACAAALSLWEQARAGLLAAVAARTANPASIHRLLFDRLLERGSDRIVSMSVRADSVETAANSFVAAHSAEDFVHFGFATDASNNATFFAPDADVLLSDEFARTYDFQLAAGDKLRPHQVGLHFAPIDHPGGKVMIDGTLWIDTVAHELREVEFQYLGVPPVTESFNPSAGGSLLIIPSPGVEEAFQPGGRIEFRTMRNGVTLIDRWSIRLAKVTADTVAELGNGRVGFDASIRRRLDVEEIGGEVARATWRDGSVWNDSLGTLRVDAATAEGRPPVGSVIALAATPYFGVVDANGIAEMRNLLPGSYSARMIDPRIAPLGLGVPTPLTVTAYRDSTTLATLAVPSTEQYLAGRCRLAHQGVGRDEVFLIGRVVTPDGTPVPGAKVTAQNAGLKSRAQSFVTGADGVFQSCEGWRIGDQLHVRVRRSGMADQELDRTFDSNIVALRVTVRPDR